MRTKMRQWILARLLVLTVMALFPIAYFVPAPYWKAQVPIHVYEEISTVKTAGVDSYDLQMLSDFNLVTEHSAKDPFDIEPRSGYKTEIVHLPPNFAESTSVGQSRPEARSGAVPADLHSDRPFVRTASAVPATDSRRTPSRQAAAAARVTEATSAQPAPQVPILDDDFSNPAFRAEYEKLACKFPVLDPWDDSIRPFLSHPQPLSCPRVQQDLTYVDQDGYLRFNETEYRKAVSMYGNLSCFYRHFDKTGEDDHSLSYVDAGFFIDPPNATRLTHGTVEVKCNRIKNTGSTVYNDIYWEIHAHPFMNTSLRSVDTGQPSLSVLIIGVDSISLPAFRRHLPMTYLYLRDVMRFHMFRGHHKVGDNSFPNQMAVLLGKRVADEHWPDMMDEVRENYRTIRFDHWPFVWQAYANKGYETSFNEDTPNWGLFHYFAQGFVKKPVHHYYHQFWLALSKGERKFLKYCFGNKAKVEMQLDLARKHLMVGRDRKWFDYIFATELFHQDEGYEAEKADPYFLKFFKEMYEGGYFNNTAVIFMSDHGHRYASLRQTLIGLLEERTPMFNIWLPEWFYRGNDFNATLHSNTVRLTSHFDIHETLLDILDNNYRSSQRPPGTRGLSLLYPISSNRTCAEAGIPPHYCTCLKETSLPTNDTSSVEAVQAAIAHLNTIVANSSSCSRLNMSNILRVERLGVSEEIARGLSGLKDARAFDAETGAPTARPLNKLRVTFTATPGHALFEAITAWNNWKSLWVVDGRIHRLNAYATTSQCIHDRFLASYCICDRKD